MKVMRCYVKWLCGAVYNPPPYELHRCCMYSAVPLDYKSAWLRWTISLRHRVSPRVFRAYARRLTARYPMISSLPDNDGMMAFGVTVRCGITFGHRAAVLG